MFSNFVENVREKIERIKLIVSRKVLYHFAIYVIVNEILIHKNRQISARILVAYLSKIIEALSEWQKNIFFLGSFFKMLVAYLKQRYLLLYLGNFCQNTFVKI